MLNSILHKQMTSKIDKKLNSNMMFKSLEQNN